MDGHQAAMAAPGLLALTGLWLAMMTAMMAAVAVPRVLAFNRLESRGAIRRGHRRFRRSPFPPATSLPRPSLLAAGILVGAGVYQFAPIKRACLTHCRAPIAIIHSAVLLGADDDADGATRRASCRHMALFDALPATRLGDTVRPSVSMRRPSVVRSHLKTRSEDADSED